MLTIIESPQAIIYEWNIVYWLHKAPGHFYSHRWNCLWLATLLANCILGIHLVCDIEYKKN